MSFDQDLNYRIFLFQHKKNIFRLPSEPETIRTDFGRPQTRSDTQSKKRCTGEQKEVGHWWTMDKKNIIFHYQFFCVVSVRWCKFGDKYYEVDSEETGFVHCLRCINSVSLYDFEDMFIHDDLLYRFPYLI